MNRFAIFLTLSLAAHGVLFSTDFGFFGKLSKIEKSKTKIVLRTEAKILLKKGETAEENVGGGPKILDVISDFPRPEITQPPNPTPTPQATPVQPPPATPTIKPTPTPQASPTPRKNSPPTPAPNPLPLPATAPSSTLAKLPIPKRTSAPVTPSRKNPGKKAGPVAAQVQTEEQGGEGGSQSKGVFNSVGIKNLPRPYYPTYAREKGHEGTVIVEFEVLESGKLGTIKIIESSGFSELDKAAISAVKKAVFVPATEDGRPVRATIKKAFTFKLIEKEVP